MTSSEEKTSLVQVRDFTKTYGALTAVNSLSFTVAAGEIFGIAGTNGAGKSTTLRALMGLIEDYEGEMLILGRNTRTDGLECRKKVAYIPEHLNPFPFLTVWEHLEFTCMAYGVAPTQEEKKDLLQTLELLDRAGNLATTLSRGMLQKMFFACALLRKSSLIIFDEPFTGLDPKGIRLIKILLKKAAQEGTGILLCSHLLPLLEELSDRVLILDKGRNLGCGSIPELRLAQKLPADVTLEELFFSLLENHEERPVCTLP